MDPRRKLFPRRQKRSSGGVLERNMLELEVAEILKKIAVPDRQRLEEICAGLTEGPQIVLSGIRRSLIVHYARLSLRDLEKARKGMEKAGVFNKFKK
ncbi:MAG: hypothetical protein L0312_21980 [Acidobacteria bacterium]|nr:hypothetical protein [Acidobacteriota bacterium]